MGRPRKVLDCVSCGKPHSRKNGSGHYTRTCSDECCTKACEANLAVGRAERIARLKVARPCRNCGGAMPRLQDDRGNELKSCSAACTHELRAKASQAAMAKRLERKALGPRRTTVSQWDPKRAARKLECEECCDMPWRRDELRGCHFCGKPYAPEPAPKPMPGFSALALAARWA